MTIKQSRFRGEHYQKKTAEERGTLSQGRHRSKGLRSPKRLATNSEKVSTVTFAGLLRSLIVRPTKPHAAVFLQTSPLAHLDYNEEIKIKNQALAMFWQHFRLPGQPEQIVVSPKPRRYRTTSKRRTIIRGGKLFLLFNDRSLRTQKKPFVDSLLEPREHGRIYTFLQNKISEPPFRLVAEHLNYLIIRGSYTERVVIFNIDTINGPLVRKLKILARHLQKIPEAVSSAYIYPDPSCSEYYLEGRQPSDILQFKKLFGKNDLAVSHHGCRYRYHPTSFSQVNESMVPKMLTLAKEMLVPQPGESLLDLYCGYGLFSHFLAADYKQVLGIDAEGPAIRAAISNKKNNPSSRKAQFLARRITERGVDELSLPDDPVAEVVLLDPPRQGPQKGVINALARRGPHKVLHIHCGVDQIPVSVKQWQHHGYKVGRVVPLDMFPGSPNLEMLIMLEQIRGRPA